MNLIDLRRRLECIEAGRHNGAPTRIMADYPVDDEDADAALANWRTRVAQGRATIGNGVLFLVEGPELSASEWAARHVTAH